MTRTQPQHASNKLTSGFTLIELLVVMTIIVVLLTILMPAMDKAIYEAKLASCGARIDAIMSGTTLYAMDSLRFYPDRKAYKVPDLQQPVMLRGKDWETQQWLDDRPLTEDYVDLHTHLDPLAGDVDLKNSLDVSFIASTYALWYDWQYTSNRLGGPGSTKIGKRFQWEGRKFTVFVGDQDWNGAAISAVGHPTQITDTNLAIYQDSDLVGAMGASTAVGFVGTMTRWEKRGRIDRGLVDVNHGFQDGSLQQFRNVGYDVEIISGLERPELVRVPFRSTVNQPVINANFFQIPRR